MEEHCGVLWRVKVCCGILPCMLVIISSRLFCEDEKFSVSYYVLVDHVCENSLLQWTELLLIVILSACLEWASLILSVCLEWASLILSVCLV